MYINGEHISTIDDPKNEHHIIIINSKEDVLISRSPIRASQAEEDYTRRPMLGVYTTKNTDVEGAHITTIIRNSPADEAGLMAGDIITKINNKEITGPDGLVATINDHNGGETVNITYTRNEREYHTDAELVETTTRRRHDTYDYKIPDLSGEKQFPSPYLHSFMFNTTDNTYEYAPQMGIEAQDAVNGRGVVVLRVKNNSPAGLAGLKEGDIILRLDHQRTTSTDDIQDILNNTWPNQRITIEFKRDGELMFAYMRFTKEKIKKDL